MRREWAVYFFFISVSLTFHLFHTLQLPPADQETIARQWIGKIQIEINDSFNIAKITEENINSFIGLYFIYEKLPDSNPDKDIAALSKDIQYVNSGLARVKCLSTMNGFAYVPTVPKALEDISSYENFVNWTGDRLKDIYKSQITNGLIMVIVTHGHLKKLYIDARDPCAMKTIIWDYSIKPEPDALRTYQDALLYEIFGVLGGCLSTCPELANNGEEISCFSLEEFGVDQQKPALLKCISKNIAKNEDIACFKVQPEDVAIPVCGNGLLEGKEQCDCLHVKPCPEECDRSTCKLQKIKKIDFFESYLILIVSGIIVTMVVVCSSLFVVCFLNRIKTSKSSISIAIGKSDTEANFIVPPMKPDRIKRKTKEKKGSKILTDPKVKKSKSKINATLDQLDPKIDLTPHEIKSAGVVSKSKTESRVKLNSQSSTMVKIKTLGVSDQTLPMGESQSKSINLSKKRSSEVFVSPKSDLNIMKTPSKSKISQSGKSINIRKIYTKSDTKSDIRSTTSSSIKTPQKK